MRSSVILVFISIVLALSSCGVLRLDKVLPDKRTEYEEAEKLPNLEIPPDLSTDSIQTRMAIPEAGGTSYSDFQRQQTGTNIEPVDKTRTEGTVIVGEGDHSVVVGNTADLLWPRLREFWKELDYGLDIDQRERLMMETVWRENSAELVRDRFRVTAVPQSGGSTAVRVAHMGEELAPDGEDLDWRPRPRDATLERKLTERLAGFLEGSLASYAPEPISATQPPAARSSDSEPAELISAGEGRVYLAIQQELAGAWRSTGLALDQAGVTVEEAHQSKGIYQIRFLEEVETEEPKKKKRVWSRLTFWRNGDENNQQFQLSLTKVGDKTEVVVLNDKGDWDTSEKGGAILVRLQRELNKLL